MKPLIGITTGEIINEVEPWVSSIYGQKHYYSDAIVAAGGIPVFIPFMPEDELKTLYTKLDGILFAGGNDIDPQLYGDVSETYTINISIERDRVESMLMTWALADNKPIFAICRGFQLFNVLLGGTLYQNLATGFPAASDHELTLHKKDYSHVAHVLKIDPSSHLAIITNSLQLNANSRHHQGVKRVANELRAIAWSEDGLVEAIEHPTKKFAIGVQSHPEALYAIDEKWLAVFRAFITASTKNHKPTRIFTLKKRVRN
jgi:putative glutamine amidotransferase